MNEIKAVKKVIQSIFFSFCLFSGAALFAGGAHGKARSADNSAYAHLSSEMTQMPKANSSSKVVMENVDAISGMVVRDNDTIEIKENGVYYISATAQIGNSGLGVFGCLNLWLTRNDEPLKHSLVTQAVEGGNRYINTTSTQTIVKLRKGDLINVAISATSSQTGLVSYVDATENKNASMQFSIFKIGS